MVHEFAQRPYVLPCCGAQDCHVKPQTCLAWPRADPVPELAPIDERPGPRLLVREPAHVNALAPLVWRRSSSPNGQFSLLSWLRYSFVLLMAGACTPAAGVKRRMPPSGQLLAYA
jgi:hypothetical protein